MTQKEIDKYSKLSARELTDLGICPTCLDKLSGGKVYGDNSKLKFYEDDQIECLYAKSENAVKKA